MNGNGKVYVDVQRQGDQLFVFMGRTEDTRNEFRFLMQDNGEWVVNQAPMPGNPVMTLDHWRALVKAVDAHLAEIAAE